MKKLLIAAAVFAFLFTCTAGGRLEAAGKVSDILADIDTLMEQRSDITAKITLTQQKVKQGLKVMEMVYYRRDSDDAFLMVMVSPETDKGNGYLRLGDNFWMYRRNTRTFQHVNRDESIGGSDAHGEDFEKKKITELYSPVFDKDGKEIYTEEKIGDIEVYKFNIVAKVKDVSYPKRTFWVRKDNSLLIKEQSYSLSGMLMSTSYFLKYTKIEGKYISIKNMFIDEFEQGNKTVMEMSGISLKKLDDSIFNKAYLENLSK